MIQLKNVTKTFIQKNRIVTALSAVSLHVAPGKIFGVIGTSGAGKSTLIRCVNLLETPTSGEIIVNGQNLLQLSRSGLAESRRQIGMIFQHFNLLSSRTVFENIAFPLELAHLPKGEIRQRVLDLLSLVGLEEKLNDYPASLSGGQKQRVAIARTLASSPKVLLCDEATSALDPATTDSILNLLKDINKRLKITILLITHEMNVVKAICDEVAVISEGKLIEQGPVSTIFSHAKNELTKKFINASLKIAIPDEFRHRLSAAPAEGKRPLIKLEFTGLSVNDPILSDVAILFQVQNNIVSAKLDYAGNVKFGTMLIEVIATPENSEKAIAYYKQKNIKTEVLGYV